MDSPAHNSIPENEAEPPATAPDAKRAAASEELRELFFKHREALQRGEPHELAEREADRVRVDELYPTLESGGEKVLDARTLGVLIDSHTQTQQQALMSHVTPAERLAMLAVIVRRSGFPVVMVPHVATLALSPLLGRERAEAAAPAAADTAAADETGMSPSESAVAQPGLPVRDSKTVRVRPVEPAQLEAAKQRLLERVQRGLDAAAVQALTVDEAQLLSIVATSRGLQLTRTKQGGLIALPRHESPKSAEPASPAHEPASGDTAQEPLPVSAGEAHLELSRPRSLCLSYAPPLPPTEDADAAASPKRRRRRTRGTPRGHAAAPPSPDTHEEPDGHAET